MTNMDGRAIARENEMRVLRALHRFGWLRTRDLAALVWQRWAAKAHGAPCLKPPESTAGGLRMAQRTLRRLREKRWVLDSRAPDGSIIYALSEAGARQLSVIGIRATSGKDLVRAFSSSHFRHRCIANEIAISGICQGFKVATEREIAQGRWPGGETGIAGKKPDVLLRGDGAAWWVEVERSRKNAKDYAKLLNWLGSIARNAMQPSGPALLGTGLRWVKVVFICTTTFQQKLMRDLAAKGWQQSHFAALLSFETTLYRFEDILFP